MSTSPTQSTKSFDGFHKFEETPQDRLNKEFRTYVEKTLQDLLNLRTSVEETRPDGKTFPVVVQNLSNRTLPTVCLARVVKEPNQYAFREGWSFVVGPVHQASVGEQDADGKTVCCDWLKLDHEDPSSVRREGCVVGSVHQASVGEQDTDDKPVCCVRLKLDEKNPSSDHEDDDLYE